MHFDVEKILYFCGRITIMDHIDTLARLLATLVAEGNYTYIDKIGYAPSRDLLMFYIKEAMRDFHSLLRSGAKNEKARRFVEEVRESIESGKLDIDDSIQKLASDVSGDRRKVREIASLLAAKALAISARFVG